MASPGPRSRNGIPFGLCTECWRCGDRTPSRGSGKCRPHYLEYQKWQARLRKYGVTRQQYEELVREQAGRCANCEREASDFLRVDHDHATGVVRGLLCGQCNIGIGNLGDNVEGLERALRYLRRSAG